MADARKVVVPRWMKPVNKAMIYAGRCGMTMGGMYVLTVPGRTSGKPRSTPLSPLLADDGLRYVVGGIPGADWVRNVRAAGGLATISVGRSTQRVRLVEVPEGDAAELLRQFPEKVPSGVSVMKDLGVLSSGTPDELAALAGQLPVFRIEERESAADQ